jgi:hypothetical protein
MALGTEPARRRANSYSKEAVSEKSTGPSWKTGGRVCSGVPFPDPGMRHFALPGKLIERFEIGEVHHERRSGTAFDH